MAENNDSLSETVGFDKKIVTVWQKLEISPIIRAIIISYVDFKIMKHSRFFLKQVIM